ncbi:MAG TPA: energy transducer TonB, partial [Thermoanaerobaculia bacterium]|nr:energy transducer TonB [Thermoanaerobaculia bacterium]
MILRRPDRRFLLATAPYAASFAALFAVVLPSLPVAAQDDAERWNQRLNEAGAYLEAGEFERARRAADEVVPLLVERLQAGGPSNEFLAFALFLKAAAEAGSEEREAALWHWWAAQNLDPKMRRQGLPDLAGAGALLRANRLREAGQLADGTPVGGGDEVVPPRPIAVPRPPSPWARWSGGVEIEILIGADGGVTQPVVLDAAGAAPGAVYEQLRALRSWRFHPATRDGEPVPATLRLTDLEGGRFPLRWIHDGDLRPVHELLLAGDWERAAARAGEVVDRATGEEAPPFGLGDALLMRAVADANLGRRRQAEVGLWAAESLHRHAFPQLQAYGDGGRFLWHERPRCVLADERREEGEGSEACPDPLADSTLTPPRQLDTEPLAAGALDGPGRPADEHVLVRLLVDAAGQPTEATIVAAADRRVTPLALSAVGGWRFEPARRDGEPVAALYETSLPLAPGLRRVEAAPSGRPDGWRRRLAALDELLTAGDHTAALPLAEALQAELERDLAAGGSDLLAAALRARALAEAGLAAAGGDGADDLAAAAAWHWQAAQNLAPQLRYRDLGAFGAAGGALAAHTLSPRDVVAELADGTATVVERVDPPAGASGGGAVEFAVTVDGEGRPRQPVWRAGTSPARLSAALEALRGWRLEAGGGGGRRLLVVQAAESAPSWSPPRGVSRLVRLAAANHDEDPVRAACLWSSAQSLEARLAAVEPSSLAGSPAAQDFLRRHLLAPPAAVSWSPQQVGVAQVGGPIQVGGDVVAPVKLFAPQPDFTTMARRAGIEGVVIVQTTIGTDGRLRGMRLLKGLSHGLDESTMETI